MNKNDISPISIADMRVVISDDVQLEETISDFVLVSHEVVIDEITNYNDCNSLLKNKINIEFITITHEAELHPQNNNMKPEVTSCKKSNLRENKVTNVAVEHDYNKIQLIEDHINPSVKILKSILSDFTPVKLNNIR